LSNSRSHNLDSDRIKNPSEGTRGFIFGTYSAAKEDLPKDKALVKSPNQGYAYISSTAGGSTSILSFEDTYKGDGKSPSKNYGGGTRGKVTGFSEASRLTLLRRLASIDYTVFEGKIFFITLTYPDICPKDSRVCKKHLEAFRKRLMRKFGVFPGFWRLGIQRRGFWHFHLLLFLPLSSGSPEALRQFVASSWYEACGKISEGHLLAGTNVEEIRTSKRVDYVGRYLAKSEEFPEGVDTGKVWGTWNKKLLPVNWETLKVSLEDAYTIRRVFRKLSNKKGTGHLRKVQVFVRHENIARLLKFLKDDNEHPRGARRPLPPQGPIPQRNASPRSSRVSRGGASRRKEEN
jgi:hypothetical protein